MSGTPANTQLSLPLEPGEIREAEAIPELLRLLGAGAPGSILLALGDRSLRTKDLITRVPGYAPRTLYRYISRLVEIGAVRSEKEQSVPSKVVHHLTEPCGIDLYRLVDRYARAALEELPGGGFVPHSWGSLTSLADLWETGMYEELTLAPRTATELARAGHSLSFHQVSRRITLLLVGGLIREVQDGKRRRRYELTEGSRQSTALIAGLGGWRERHRLQDGEAGLTRTETGEVLRAVLPLLNLPDHGGKRLELAMTSANDNGRLPGEVIVGAQINASGALTLLEEPLEDFDGWGRGDVSDWLRVLLDGEVERVRVGGDPALVQTAVREIHKALWADPDADAEVEAGSAESEAASS